MHDNVHQKICSRVFAAALLSHELKQPQCLHLFITEWTNCGSFTKERYIATKVSKLLHKHKLSKKARHKILTVDSIYKKFYNYKPN